MTSNATGPTVPPAFRAAAAVLQKQAAVAYENALADVWEGLEATMLGLAVTHHKTLNAVRNDLIFGRGRISRQRRGTSSWNAFVWKQSQSNQKSETASAGKLALQDILKQRHEYEALSSEQKEELVKEFEVYKTANAKVARLSREAKVRDFSSTLVAIETGLECWQNRPGIAAMVFPPAGLPMNGATNAAEDVENLPPAAPNIDLQHIPEGSSMQGAQGTTKKNHKQRLSATRTELRKCIQNALVTITSDPKATMRWSYYWRDVVSKYRITIKGWPGNIPFGNLSDVITCLPDMETLLKKWKLGEIYFEAIGEEEYVKLQAERNEQIEAGLIQEPRRKRSSDKGSKRRHTNADTTETSRKKQKTKITSKEFVSTDTDGSDDSE